MAKRRRRRFTDDEWDAMSAQAEQEEQDAKREALEALAFELNSALRQLYRLVIEDSALTVALAKLPNGKWAIDNAERVLNLTIEAGEFPV